MAVIDSNLRKLLGPDLIGVFRQVLYDKVLSYGSKCLWLAINDSPKVRMKKKTIFAERFGTSNSTITRWVKELKKRGFIIQGKNSQA